MGLTYDQLDISAEEMEDVDLYMQGLGVPARRDVNDPTVKRGEEMFYQAKCTCAIPVTLHTQPRGSTLLLGTQLTCWQPDIHPYSIPASRHGKRNHGCRIERQLRKRTGPRQ